MIAQPKCLGSPCLFHMSKLAMKFRVLIVRGCAVVALVSIGSQCASKPRNYGKKPPRDFSKVVGSMAPGGIQDTLDTPPHNFSRKDYPFDARGNYREDWIRSGSSSASPKKRSSSSSSSSSSSTAAKRYHVVRTGDTLYSLSRQYNVTLYALRRENGLADYSIRVGQVLRIPKSN